MHVAIQGVGKVGRNLAEMLDKDNARITICDPDSEAVKQIVNKLNCNVVEAKDIFGIECDVFSPCALGGVINKKTIDSLKCKIICGAANNQIYDDNLLNTLTNKNIFFMPDWICNVGGTIYAAHSYLDNRLDMITEKVRKVLIKRTNEFIDLTKKSKLHTATQTFIRTIS